MSSVCLITALQSPTSKHESWVVLGQVRPRRGFIPLNEIPEK
jgi:hypothetical protein